PRAPRGNRTAQPRAAKPAEPAPASGRAGRPRRLQSWTIGRSLPEGRAALDRRGLALPRLAVEEDELWACGPESRPARRVGYRPGRHARQASVSSHVQPAGAPLPPALLERDRVLGGAQGARDHARVDRAGVRPR